MKIYTYTEAKTKIDNDLDLAEEDFISADEMKGLFNDAIDDAEADIHILYEGYFKKTLKLNLLIHNQTQDVTITNGTPDLIINSTNHGVKIDNRVKFTAFSLPGNIASDTYYFVVSVIDSNSYKVSATRRGSAVAFVSAGTAVKTVYEGQRYLMPTDIYANKIIHMQFNDGANSYKLIKVKQKHIDYLNTRAGTNENYQFDLEHVDPTIGPELILYPAGYNTGEVVTMFYIRNANAIVNDTDRIDIPEFINFIFAYVKYMVSFKERNPLLQGFKADMEEQRRKMKETLDTMVPDEETLLEPDTSFYEEFGLDELYGRQY